MSGKIRFLGLVTLLGLLGALLLIGPSAWAQKAKPPQPPSPPADPAIAYVVNNYSGAAMKKTKAQLMVMNADGSNQRVVVSGTGVEYLCPDWSPDGTQLVFTRNNIIGGDSGIYIINVNGTGLRKVVNFRFGDSYCYRVTWSPMALEDKNGSKNYKIAFTDSVRRPDGTYEIDHESFIVNLDGTGLVQLTNQRIGGSPMFWSPTADRVTMPAIGGFGVYKINYDSEHDTYTLETLSTCSEFGWGVWANTKEKLAVGKGDAGGVNDIWIYDLLNPSYSYQLTSTPGKYEHDQSWSPDDSKILFVQGPSGQLYVINSDGSGLITPICPGVDFTWRSPRWRRNS